MLQTINYNKVDPDIYFAQIFLIVANIKFTLYFIKSLEIREVLLGVHILLNTNSQ